MGKWGMLLLSVVGLAGGGGLGLLRVGDLGLLGSFVRFGGDHFRDELVQVVTGQLARGEFLIRRVE